jgi:hypothetical protein
MIYAVGIESANTRESTGFPSSNTFAWAYNNSQTWDLLLERIKRYERAAATLIRGRKQKNPSRIEKDLIMPVMAVQSPLISQKLALPELAPGLDAGWLLRYRRAGPSTSLDKRVILLCT